MCLVSGGLGPTHDDRTVELLARAPGVALVVDPELEARDRGGLARRRRAAERAYADFAPGRDEAGDAYPKARVSLGLAGTAPGLVLRTPGGLRRRRPARARRASCSGSGRARSRRSRCASCSRARAPPGRRVLRLLRRQRVGGRARARRGGRRRRRGRGDDLRARLRDPRRPRRRAGRGGARGRARGARSSSRSSAASSPATSAPSRSIVLDALPRARADARDGRVVHRRARRRAADVGPGLERRLRRAASSPTRTRSRRRELGVPAALLDAHGAVSAEVAEAMARGARERLGADVGGRGDRDRRPGRRHAREAGRARLPPRRRAGRRARRASSASPATATSIRARAAVGALHLVRAASDTELGTKPYDLARLAWAAMNALRLFLALRLPDDALDALEAWQARRAAAAVRVVPREHLHVTLAFLGAPAGRRSSTAIVGVAARRRGGGEPEMRARRRCGYRETRSVGMLVLDDDGRPRGARSRATCRRGWSGSASTAGSARPWLPHLTVVRFRERPRLGRSRRPGRTFVPSDAAAYLSRLRPSGAQYEVLGIGVLGVRSRRLNRWTGRKHSTSRSARSSGSSARARS